MIKEDVTGTAKKGSTARTVIMMYPWQTFPYQTGSPAVTPLPVMPSSLAKHPQMWTKEEVAVWLKWCVEEYSITQVPSDKFSMNGKALCVLTRNDFMERVPEAGDILYNVLQKLISRNAGPMLYQPLPTYPSIASGNTMCCTPTPCSLPEQRRDNTFLVVPGSARRTNVPHPRPNYIPILPNLKPNVVPNAQRQENGLKHPIPITPFRLALPNPPEAVLSPAPSAGSDSNQSDHRSDNGSSPPNNDEGHDLHSKDGYRNNGMEVQDTTVTTAPTTPIYHSPTDTSHINPLWREKNTDCRLLWEFINYLLVNGNYTDYIRWEDKERLTFRIINPTALAELWGIQKNRTNMTYEKLSRALRYYYKMNIIKKVPGKRLTYQFLRQPKDIKKGQRGARPQPRPPPSQYPYSPCDMNLVPTDGDRPYPASPSPPSLSSERSSLDSIGYNGLLDVLPFPVQEEPEDLSVRVLLKERMMIKRENMVVQHDVNANDVLLKEYSDNNLPTNVTTVIKQEPDVRCELASMGEVQVRS